MAESNCCVLPQANSAYYFSLRHTTPLLTELTSAVTCTQVKQCILFPAPRQLPSSTQPLVPFSHMRVTTLQSLHTGKTVHTISPCTIPPLPRHRVTYCSHFTQSNYCSHFIQVNSAYYFATTPSLHSLATEVTTASHFTQSNYCSHFTQVKRSAYYFSLRHPSTPSPQSNYCSHFTQ
ncbi:hypothetical protein RRG08_000915, partial [Elysia crispata]